MNTWAGYRRTRTRARRGAPASRDPPDAPEDLVNEYVGRVPPNADPRSTRRARLADPPDVPEDLVNEYVGRVPPQADPAPARY